MIALESTEAAIGSYDLLQLIAEGGMATVHKARRRQTGEIVAIKIMPPRLAKDPVLLKRFQQEYQAARAIDHVNIVRALEFGHDGGRPYLVMEFVDGESLGQKLQREGRLHESDAIRIISQIAQGLHRAHKKGLVHRDVKPDNILLSADGQAKLTDLGLVKEVETEINLTRAGRGLGTPHFMAPEQFRDARNADRRCDIYSLAATMYQMVTGVLPFQSTGPVDAWMKKVNNDLAPPRDLVPDLSERVDWAIRRGMSPDRQQRPASCREFLEDLTGHSTRRQTHSPGERAVDDLWYMLYTAANGVVHTAKGSLSGIRRSVIEGRLGDAATWRVGRSKAGPFLPLREYAEFRDLVIDITAPVGQTSVASPPSPQTTTTPDMPSSSSSSGLVPSLPRPEMTADMPLRPLIPLQSAGNSADWWKWVALVLVALGSALAGYFLAPFLRYLPFF